MSELIRIEKYISKLDTERFGFKIAKTDFSGIEPEKAVREFKKFGVGLVISRVNGGNISLVNKLEDLGFRVKDNQLTYKYDLNDPFPDAFQAINEYIIRDFKNEDIELLVKFTEESFSGYGHYFADSRLDAGKCLEIYKDWVQRSCFDKNVADKVIVAEFEGKAIGYLSFKIFEKDKFKYAAGGLGSVSKQHRNKSIFRAITLQGLKWGKDINLNWEEHNVLSSNYSVNRSFSKMGFRIVCSYITFHCWLD